MSFKKGNALPLSKVYTDDTVPENIGNNQSYEKCPGKQGPDVPGYLNLVQPSADEGHIKKFNTRYGDQDMTVSFCELSLCCKRPKCEYKWNGQWVPAIVEEVHD